MSGMNGQKITINFHNTKLTVDNNITFEKFLTKLNCHLVMACMPVAWPISVYHGLSIDGKLYDIPNTQLSGKPLCEIPIKDGSLVSLYDKEIDIIPQINIRSAYTNPGGSQARNEIKTTFKDLRNLTDPWNFKDAWNYDYKKYRDNYFFRFKNKDCRLNRIYIPHPTYIQSIKNCATQTGISIAPIQVKPHVINNSLAGYRPRFYSASLSSRRYKQIAYQVAL